MAQANRIITRRPSLSNVRWLPEARAEFLAIPDVAERTALQHVADKLEAMGVQLDFPHQSAIQGTVNLRELRPRRGKSPWRAFYQRAGQDLFVIAGVGPEATVDPSGFLQAYKTARDRLSALQGKSP